MRKLLILVAVLIQTPAFAQQGAAESLYQQGRVSLDGLLSLAQQMDALRAENEALRQQVYACRNPNRNEIYADHRDKNASIQYFYDTECTQPMPKMWMSHDKKKNEALCEVLVKIVDRAVKVRGIIKSKGPGSGQCLAMTTRPVGVYEECLSVGTQTIF